MANPLVIIGDPTAADDLNTLKGRVMTAGAGGLSAFDVCYLSGSDALLKADNTAAGTMPAICIVPAAISAAATGDAVFHGLVTNAGWSGTFSAGNILYVGVSGVAGGLTATRPTGTATTIIQPVGIMLTNTTAWFNFTARLDAKLFSTVGLAKGVPIGGAAGKLSSTWGGDASTVATLDGSSLVVQNPANATATPTASKIPIADASGFLDNNWLGNLRMGNWVKNPQFDIWSAGTAAASDQWLFDGGTGGTIGRSTSNILFGLYSAIVTSGSAYVSNLYQNIDASFLNYVKGKTFTLSAWVNCATGGKARIGISDGVATQYSGWHTGSGAHEKLSKSITVSESATFLQIQLLVDPVSIAAYFNGVSLVEGDQDFGYNPSVFDRIHRKDMRLGNWVRNGQFDMWEAGTSVAPDFWLFAGTGATVAREAAFANIRVGLYSAVLASATGDSAQLYENLDTFLGTAYWQGKTVTVGAWVKCATASKARIYIYDDTTQTFSGYHTGGGGWERLSVTATLGAGATTVRIAAIVDAAPGGVLAYFDCFSMVEGDQDFGYSPSVYDAHYTHIENVSIAADTGGDAGATQSITGMPRPPKKVRIMAVQIAQSGTAVYGSSFAVDGKHRPAEYIGIYEETGSTRNTFRAQAVNNQFFYVMDATGANIQKGTGLTFNADGITWTNISVAAGLGLFLRIELEM